MATADVPYGPEKEETRQKALGSFGSHARKDFPSNGHSISSGITGSCFVVVFPKRPLEGHLHALQ